MESQETSRSKPGSKIFSKFLHKIADALDSNDNSSSSSTPAYTPPSQPNFQPPQESSNYQSSYGQNPIPEFGNMSMGDNSGLPPRPQQQSQPSFIGGFHPNIPSYDNGASVSAPNLPQPPSFSPAPYNQFGDQQSLTMQYALQPPNTPYRPQSNPDSSSAAGASPGRLSGAKPPKPPASAPVTPSKGRRSDSDDFTPSPAKPGQEQCAGVTKAGKRCTRMVKSRPSTVSADQDDDEPTPVFCHQHSKELMGPTGYYARKNGVQEWVKFEDWIPAYLQSDTQTSLRVEMEKPRSQSDVPGYIYTFEIREEDEVDTIKLKVGRAVNVVKRIDEWGKQCGSKEHVMRGFYPGGVEAAKASMMKGRAMAGEPGPSCHRLERLIHLELADLTAHCVYLDPAWPDTEATSTPGSEEKAKGPHDGRKPCADCGSRHKEIFEFERWKKGKHKGKEWEDIVKPVVERWGKFVELYV